MKQLALLLMLPMVAFGQSASLNYNLPNTQPFPQGTDRIRTESGVECSHSTGPRNAYFELGGFGGATSGVGSDSNGMGTVINTGTGTSTVAEPNPFKKGVGGGYAKLVINLDVDKPELNCQHLYNLELERLKEELAEARMMRATPKAKISNPN